MTSIMARSPKRKRSKSDINATLITAAALVMLLLIASYALLGPTGVIAWTDYRQALKERKVELASLEKERNALRNKQKLLNRDNVDPDLAGELMRKDLNVVAPDEIVVPLNNNE